MTLNLAVPRMEEQCGGKVKELYPGIVHQYAPTPPDTGTVGSDGG